MWYYNGEIIKTPKTMTVLGLQYSKDLFKDAEKMAELGIKPYREVTPDSRYFNNAGYSIDTSGDEVVGTYASSGKDTDGLTKNMLGLIKSQLTSKLADTDWYYLRKLRTGTDVPADIQDYSDTLYSEYDTKKSEISAMNKISQIEEYQNRPHTEVRKVKTTNTEGKTVYGPKTISFTRHINMCTHWTSNPDVDVDPAFVSLTAD
jgi:ABC-type antimicrobial peptide transport system permease subunit